MSHLVDPDLTQRNLRTAFGKFPSGVTAICAMIDGAPEGLVASSFTSVSLEPPYVSVCIAHSSKTWRRLRAARRLGISVLGAEHRDTARLLASRAESKFDAVQWEAPDNEAVFVHGSSVWIDCRVIRVVGVGDHDIVVLEVGAVLAFPDIPPLVFHESTFREIAG